MKKNLVAAAIGAALTLPVSLHAQEWTYRMFLGEGTPSEQTVTFRLKETAPGQHAGRFLIGGTADECVKRDLKATVSDEAAERIVVLHPAMAGCPERRLLLKTDGSGGRMEEKQADGSWKWDGRERGLKRKP